MQARAWIKEAEKQGWRLRSVRGLEVCLECAKHGCPGSLVLPLDNLGPVPSPCALPHSGQYAARAVETYAALVSELQRRRRSLGLSQEDVTAASGLADGHINKLEAFARTAQFPTLQLWAETLGLSIRLEPAPLPPKTAQTIEERTTNPYRADKANTKHHQPSLFHDDR